MVQISKLLSGIGIGISIAALSSSAFAQDTDSSSLHYTPDFFASLQPVTALDMISRLPGFVFNAGAGNDVRGYAQAAGNVLINGQRPASKTEGLDLVLSRIPAESVERIDLIRGGAPGIDMQGKSVVANVITKKHAGKALSGNIILEVRAFEDGVSRPNFKTELLGSVNAIKWEASLKLQTNREDSDGKGRYNFYDATGKLIQSSPYSKTSLWNSPIFRLGLSAPVAGGTLTWSGMVNPYRFRYNADTQNPDIPDQTRGRFRSMKYEHSLRFTRALNDTLDLELVALNTQAHPRENTFYGPLHTNHFQERGYQSEVITKGSLSWHPNAQLDLIFDGERALNTSKDRILNTTPGQPVSLSQVAVTEERYEFGVVAKWRPLKGLLIETGVRQETSEVTTSDPSHKNRRLSYTKPRFVLGYDLTPADQVRLTIENRVSQLNLDDFTPQYAFDTGAVYAGNSQIRTDQRWSYNLDGEHRFGDKGVLSLNLYYEDITDTLDRRLIITPDGTFDTRANVGNATYWGAKAAVTLPLDKVGIPLGLLNLSHNWSESEVKDPTTGQMRHFSGFSTFWKKGISFSQDLPQWQAKWGINANLGQKFRVWRAEEIRKDYYGDWVEAFIDIKPAKNWFLHLEASNILARNRGFERQLYGDMRPSPIQSFQKRDVAYPRYLYLSLKRTF